MPALKPTITLSEKKSVVEPARTIRASTPIAPTMSAVQAASAPKRAGSPPASAPSEEPISSEIAEVTVIAVCREPLNIQYTRAGNRHA
jgi:hypothetical protein